MRNRTALWSALVLALLAPLLAGCTGQPGDAEPRSTPTASPPPATAADTATPAVDAPQPTSAALAARYGFPTRIDPARRYLFYLHGRIVEDQGLPAISPEFGEYEYEEILEVLEGYGFVVVSEQRPRDADGWEFAGRTASQVAALLAAGVPPGSITVVGASKGATIAVGVSYLVGEPEVNYVLLGSCHSSLIDLWRQQEMALSGNVLAIYDVADDEYSGSCEALFDMSEGKGLSRHDEILLQVGTGHGILYQPLPEWVLPTVRWANQEW